MTTIRRARAREAGMLTSLSLRSKATSGYDEAFMAACVAEMTVNPADIAAGEVWVGEDGSQEPAPVGFYELIIADDGSGAGELCKLYVAPEAKGTGVGGALWRHIELRAAHHGLTRIGLDADPFAQAFYQHMGCVVVGSSPSGSIPGRTLPRMEKTLTFKAKG
ncbi:FIG01201438: hypothetical protein [hydrothermal vent metagenome]|uniref:N-acetyltransferase domain-containing protein n=1 Tax=hydrothermal vent metagenome TaxID=652676 RepID=A0A3B0TU46_9ZZZZ